MHSRNGFIYPYPMTVKRIGSNPKAGEDVIIILSPNQYLRIDDKRILGVYSLPYFALIDIF